MHVAVVVIERVAVFGVVVYVAVFGVMYVRGLAQCCFMKHVICCMLFLAWASTTSYVRVCYQHD